MTKAEMMARNKENYLKAKGAFNRGRIDECVLFYAEDHEVKSKQSEKGRDGIQKFLEGLHQTWPDIQITVEHSVAEDDWVMGRSVATATHSQVVLGVQPTNKKITATFWDLHRFDDDGLMIETWNLMDSLAIMQQIGLLK
ncbi:MAG TPA: ester cyclase [Pyrinomonadaceae bacterium]|nr:ester cyclase [Pyrinomonadaceae bacterium]